MDAAVIGCEVTRALAGAARGLDLAREIRRDLVMACPEEGPGDVGVSERLWRGR